MRTHCLILASCGLLLGLLSVNRAHFVSNVFNNYCVVVKDGKPQVRFQGKTVKTTVTLADGIQIKPDAILVDKNGNARSLNTGECVNEAGEIIQAVDVLANY